MGYNNSQQVWVERQAEQAGLTDEDLDQIAAEITNNPLAGWRTLNSRQKSEFEERLSAGQKPLSPTQPTAVATASRGPAPATERQVTYLAKLLAQKWKWGLEPKLEDLIGDGGPDFPKLRALTAHEASQRINLLLEQY